MAVKFKNATLFFGVYRKLSGNEC